VWICQAGVFNECPFPGVGMRNWIGGTEGMGEGREVGIAVGFGMDGWVRA